MELDATWVPPLRADNAMEPVSRSITAKVSTSLNSGRERPVGWGLESLSCDASNHVHICMVPHGFQSALRVFESGRLDSWELAPCCSGKSQGLSWVSDFPGVTEGFMAGIQDCSFVVQGSGQLEGTSRDGDNGLAWIRASRAVRGLRGTAGSREQRRPQTPVIVFCFLCC